MPEDKKQPDQPLAPEKPYDPIFNPGNKPDGGEHRPPGPHDDF